MSETIGRLLAAGQRAEVFEWGCRVVKLWRSTGSKQVMFREAAINAAIEKHLFSRCLASYPRAAPARETGARSQAISEGMSANI